MNRIKIEGLTKYYGSDLVLDRIDLTVAKHEVVCMIGASGSGKSTLLRCINRLVDFDHGVIRFDGVPVDDPSFGKTGLYRHIGIVFQSFNLFPHLTVTENILLAPCKVHATPRKEALETARRLLDAFGLTRFADAYPEQLSGGQQQRIAIIRSLATNPDVMLLDEITASLDPELVGDVLRIIRELKNQGMTMIIVTHEMGFARDVSDRVCFLADGRILEEDVPQRLFKAPRHPRAQQFLQRIVEAGRL